MGSNMTISQGYFLWYLQNIQITKQDFIMEHVIERA